MGALRPPQHVILSGARSAESKDLHKELRVPLQEPIRMLLRRSFDSVPLALHSAQDDEQRGNRASLHSAQDDDMNEPRVSLHFAQDDDMEGAPLPLPVSNKKAPLRPGLDASIKSVHSRGVISRIAFSN